MAIGNAKSAVQKDLEERVESEDIARVLDDIIRITNTEERPAILFKNIAREISYEESSILSAYRGNCLSLPKRVYDYLIRLKKRLDKNTASTVVVDGNRQKLIIDFGEFEKAYNTILRNYRMGEDRLNSILNKRFNTNHREIERYLASSIIKGRRMEEIFKFLAMLGNRERMEYDPSKAYNKGDYLCLNNLGLGEVVEIEGKNMKAAFCGKLVELKCGFMEGEGIRASNFTAPVYESYIN